MKRLLLLALCLALSACSAPTETPEISSSSELTAEEAREVLAQALLERNASFLSYDIETGFEAEEIHYVWGNLFWNEEVPEGTAGDTKIYCFDLCYGPDADDGLDDTANPMAGRLVMSYGVGRDGGSLWQYRADLGDWEPLPDGTG